MNFPLHDRRALPAGLRLSETSGHSGWRLRRYDWASAGEPPRGSILFQSGRGDFVEKYIEALAHWHDRGWNIAGFDWRGQGGSARTGTGDSSSFDAMVEDAAGFIPQWIQATPAPHILIGHSMGGHVLMRLLAERLVMPQSVRATILVSPMLGLAHAPLSTRMARLIANAACRVGLGQRPLWNAASVTPISRQANLTGSAERYADESWWRETQPELGTGPPEWRWLAQALGSIARLDAPGALERVKLPVLLLGTDRDRLVSAAAIRRAAARLPMARLEMLDGAHELLREADMPRTAAFTAIDSFLDSVAPRT